MSRDISYTHPFVPSPHQNSWVELSLAAPSEIAINEVLSVLRLTVRGFCGVSAVGFLVPPMLDFTGKKPVMAKKFNIVF